MRSGGVQGECDVTLLLHSLNDPPALRFDTFYSLRTAFWSFRIAPFRVGLMGLMVPRDVALH